MQEHERVYLNLKNDISRLSLGKKNYQAIFRNLSIFKKFLFSRTKLRTSKT